MSVRNTLARNTLFNAGGRMWEAVCNFVLAAYIVPRIGLSAWGLWALVSVFTSYVALLDFGLGSGFTKYIAEHAARKDEEALSATVSTGFFAYLILGAMLVALAWPAVDAIFAVLVWFKPSLAQASADTAFIDDAKLLLRWGLVLFAGSNCIGAFAAIQTGLQRMGVTNAIGFVASIVKVAAVVVFLEAGYGVRGLLFANAVAFVFFAAASVVAAYRLAPGLRVGWAHVRWDAFQRLFRYGWRTQVSKFANIVMFQTDKLLVGAVCGSLAMVGVYRIGEELANKMRQAPALLLSAVIPAVSDLDARGDSERVRRLYLLSSKYVAAVTIPLVAVSVGCAGPIVRAWMGSVEHLDVAAWVFRIMAFGYVANILPGAGVSIALGMGRPDVQMKAGIIATVANVALTVLFVFSIGFYGIPLGTAFSMALSCAWFMSAMRSVASVDVRSLLRTALLWPVVAAAPGFAVCLAGDWLSANLADRLSNLCVLAGCSAVFMISYAFAIWYSPFLDAFDARFLGETLKLDRVPGFRPIARRMANRV